MTEALDTGAAVLADELSLAQRIARGDRAAFEVLMRRYNRRLYRLARASLRDDAEAKDALQDAYFCAYRSIGQFRGDAALSTWLSRLVLNECAARRRRSMRRENIVPIVSADPNMEASRACRTRRAARALHARAQMRSVLERKVGELPEILRLVFVLRSIEELSVEEIAATLSISQEACAAGTSAPRACCASRSPGKSISPRATSTSSAACTATAWWPACWRA